MPPTLDYTETLVVTHCWCGIAVGLPSTLHQRMRESSKRSAYCPLGHSFSFTSDLIAEAEAETERMAQRLRATQDLLAAEERAHRATKGHVTRMKKRESAGVCPCCNRSFQNVARHMASKHPDYAR